MAHHSAGNPAAAPGVAKGAVLPFIMLDAERCQAPMDIDGPGGEYDPVTQTWTGRIRIGAGTYSSRSNGSKGGYSYQSDD